MLHIFNQRLAGYLMLKGYKLEYIEPNRNNDNYNMFCFENSPQIKKAMENYKKIKQFII